MDILVDLTFTMISQLIIYIALPMAIALIILNIFDARSDRKKIKRMRNQIGL